jgi:hypothetical protein
MERRAGSLRSVAKILLSKYKLHLLVDMKNAYKKFSVVKYLENIGLALERPKCIF